MLYKEGNIVFKAFICDIGRINLVLTIKETNREHHDDAVSVSLTFCLPTLTGDST